MVRIPKLPLCICLVFSWLLWARAQNESSDLNQQSDDKSASSLQEQDAAQAQDQEDEPRAATGDVALSGVGDTGLDSRTAAKGLLIPKFHGIETADSNPQNHTGGSSVRSVTRMYTSLLFNRSW